MEKKDLLLNFQNNQYKILVNDYDNGFIKVSMQNIETKETQDITLDAVHLVVPSAPTPNCAWLNDNQELIEQLLELGILEDCHSLMGKFSMKELYFYDHIGVKKFIDKYAHEVAYRKDKGNTEDEIKKNIRKDAREVLNCKQVKEYLEDRSFNMNTFLYSVLDKNNIKESFVVFADENAEFEAFVQPYRNGIEDQVQFIPDYAYNNMGWLCNPLNANSQIIQMNKNIHEWIISELEEYYPDFDFKKGVEKYVKYCISKKIDKEDFMKNYTGMKKMMETERIKLQERSR